MKKYDAMMNEALEELKNNDNLFVSLVDEMDSWNGFADGFRAYPMYELDELFGDCKVSDFLDKLAGDFNHNDEYMIDSIWGLSSCNDITDHYRANVDEGELLDAVIDEYYSLDIKRIDADFDELIQEIVDYDEEEEESAIAEIMDAASDTVKELFEAMRNNLTVMSEHNDDERELAEELIDSDEEILAEYAATYLA